MQFVWPFVILRCTSCRSADVWLVKGSNIEPSGRKIYGFFVSCKACGRRSHSKYTSALEKTFQSQCFQKKHKPISEQLFKQKRNYNYLKAPYFRPKHERAKPQKQLEGGISTDRK